MEEVEEFDPTDPEESPRTLLDMSKCIQLAKELLRERFGYSLSPSNHSENDLFRDEKGNSPRGIDSFLDGVLFYPCAAQDTDLVTEVFSNLVSSIQFCDVIYPQGGEFERIGDSNKKADIRSGGSLIVPHVGRVFNETSSEIYINRRLSSTSKASVRYCVGDSVHYLLSSIEKISVFFYRRDSPNPDGEGGSGVLWFGPVLLDFVLSRMLNGGILCTDFSNSSGFLAKSLKALKCGEKVQYKDLTLTRLEASSISEKLESLVVIKISRT